MLQIEAQLTDQGISGGRFFSVAGRYRRLDPLRVLNDWIAVGVDQEIFENMIDLAVALTRVGQPEPAHQLVYFCGRTSEEIPALPISVEGSRIVEEPAWPI